MEAKEAPGLIGDQHGDHSNVRVFHVAIRLDDDRTLVIDPAPFPVPREAVAKHRRVAPPIESLLEHHAAAAEQGAPKISRASDPRLKAFKKAFNAVLADLSEQVARDGEGARHLVEVIVEGAVSKKSARKIALSVANSPLVKTAIAGEDANWGRVVMAIGKAGEPANRDRISIAFNGIRVATRGERDPSYDEAQVSETMKQPEIQIRISLGLGKGRDRVLTCDLTKEYVAINGDYRS